MQATNCHPASTGTILRWSIKHPTGSDRDLTPGGDTTRMMLCYSLCARRYRCCGLTA